MKTEPIMPARIEFADGQPPHAPLFGDVYHAQAGAQAQARHVFMRGNGLPARWAGRRRFVIVETGFGLGNNFLATWDAWQNDPARCAQIVYLAIERHPPTRADLVQAHDGGPLPALAGELLAGWPTLTPNIHPIDFEGGRVRLLLALGDIARMLPQLCAQADALYLDGFAPRCNPSMWDRRAIRGLARLCAPGATVATWSVARDLRSSLVASGFEVRRTPGFDRKREMTEAIFAPAFVPRRSPGRAAALDTPLGRGAAQPQAAVREALIMGAGLAGACAAASLARLGWRCKVLERHASPAQAASGNPAGLYHGTVHGDDGLHARFTRACALWAHRGYARGVAAGHVAGQTDGLVRLRPGGSCAAWPGDYVHELEDESLQGLTGVPIRGPAWSYPAGGWVAPRDVVNELLRTPGVELVAGVDVARIARSDAEGPGAVWQAFDTGGAVIHGAPVLVLAGGASDVLLHAVSDAASWPLQSVRGQVSWFESPALLRRPLAGHGYALSLSDGQLFCGATTTAGDSDASTREIDHAFNLQRLQELASLGPVPGAPLHGRVGWRAVAKDRLPIVGAVPRRLADITPATRIDHARMVPRIPGLFVLGGLASRGLTWGPLAGEVLAAWIDGAPIPLEADLLDAIDPARWLARRARRAD